MRVLLVALHFLLLAGHHAAASTGEPLAVDVELVLAVDVSRSMTARELEIQRRGYAAAITSDEVLEAIGRGAHRRIAVTYVEWAGEGSQRIIADWAVIEDRASAGAFAARLTAEFDSSLRRTSISGAIDHAARLFDGNGFWSDRQVIDISGDGPNNQGRPVEAARDEALARGIVINGLPLMTREGMGYQWHLEDLDAYYRHCVVGGPGSFVIPVLEWSHFPEAVRRKLILDLVRQPQPQEQPRVLRAAARPDYDCMIGEKIWEDMQRDWY